jgi:uncharacterized membrane protein YbhN (UPF0104 family)
MIKKHIYNIIKVIISAGILYYLISLADLHKFLEVTEELDYFYLIICLAGTILLLSIKATRWCLILRTDNIKYQLYKSVKAYFASFSIGVVTPGRLGEFIKLYYLRQDINTDFYSGLKSVILDRFFDLFILIIFGLAGILVLFFNTGTLFSVSMMVLIVFMSLIILKATMGAFNTSNKILVFARELISALINYKNIVNWIITLIAYLLFFYLNSLIFRSLDISLSFIDITFIISIVSLVILLPVTVAGFGTREASLIYLLSFFDIPVEKVLLFSFLQFLLFFIWGGIVGLILWLISPVPLQAIKKDAGKAFSFVRNIINNRKLNSKGLIL